MGARRGRGDGSIFRRKDGRYCAEKSAGVAPDGTRIRKTIYGRTRNEVRAKLRELNPRQESTSLADLVKRWLEHVSVNLAFNTVRNYERGARQLAALGHMRVDHVTTGHLQRVLDTAPSGSVRLSWYQATRTLFRDAVTWGVIDRSPAEGMRRPGYDPGVPETWTVEQARRFLQVIDNPSHLALMSLALGSGLRSGEVRALEWPDIDLDAGTVRVRRAVVDRKKEGGRSATKPKTRTSQRVVAVAPEILALLGALPRRGPLIFAGKDGSYASSEWLAPLTRRYCEAAGVPSLTYHGLRHVSASLLLSSGASMRVVQERLGHASPTTTQAVYAHVSGPEHAAAGAFFGGLLGVTEKKK